MGFTGHEYGFVVLGETAGGLKAVTNLREDSGMWTEGVGVASLEPDPASVSSCLVELDRAAPVLPERLLLFENVDWPLYVLHDIRADGNSFTFGMCGAPQQAWMTKPLPSLDYAQTAAIMNSADPGQGVSYESDRGKALSNYLKRIVLADKHP
jgi:hypothetical protein